MKERQSADRSDNDSTVTEEDVQSYLAKMFEQETQQLVELQQQLDTYIEEQGLSSQLETTLNNHQLLITFSDTALLIQPALI